MSDLPQYFLARQSDSGQETFGILQDSNRTTLCCTIERPWLDNQPDISCIPLGTYQFYRFLSPKNGDVWRSYDVPDRNAIEMHAANFASELEGCIAVGNAMGEIDGIPAVKNSIATLAMLRTKLPDRFNLTIEGVPT